MSDLSVVRDPKIESFVLTILLVYLLAVEVDWMTVKFWFFGVIFSLFG